MKANIPEKISTDNHCIMIINFLTMTLNTIQVQIINVYQNKPKHSIKIYNLKLVLWKTT